MSKSSFYLKFRGTKKYNKWSASAPKAFATKPKIDSDEILVKFEIEIPDQCFEKPTLIIKGNLPAMETSEIELSIANEAKELIERNMGIEVRLEN